LHSLYTIYVEMNSKLFSEDFSHYNGSETTLRHAQLRMFEILQCVSDICNRHNIPYWIDYGTLLGAVRHQGFIPWDDDLDISILYTDYDKLSLILSRELPEHFKFQDWRNEKKLMFKVAKVRDVHSYYDDGLTKRGEMKYQGIFIDIFPVQKSPSFAIKSKIDFIYSRVFRRLRGFNNDKIEYFISIMLWPFANFLVFLSRLMTIIQKKKLVSNIYGGLNLPISHDLNDIFPLSEILFEGEKFKAPRNFDKILKTIYGDYMIIPPVEKRITHANKIEID